MNVGIYARPHFLDESDDSTCALVTSDRVSHAHVKANPHAAYLFAEGGKNEVGKKLALTMVREETDIENIESIRRRRVPTVSEEGMKYLVCFRVDGVRPLIGAE